MLRDTFVCDLLPLIKLQVILLLAHHLPTPPHPPGAPPPPLSRQLTQTLGPVNVKNSREALRGLTAQTKIFNIIV